MDLHTISHFSATDYVVCILILFHYSRLVDSFEGTCGCTKGTTLLTQAHPTSSIMVTRTHYKTVSNDVFPRGCLPPANIWAPLFALFYGPDTSCRQRFWALLIIWKSFSPFLQFMSHTPDVGYSMSARLVIREPHRSWISVRVAPFILCCCRPLCLFSTSSFFE